MPRFVILAHDWPRPHWDLLLEAGPVLRAWRLLAEPAPGCAIPAEPNADHRLHYLDYEGPVSGGRGEVWRWDAGTYTGDFDAAGGWRGELRGMRLCGPAEITGRGGAWVFWLTPVACAPGSEGSGAAWHQSPSPPTAGPPAS